MELEGYSLVLSILAIIGTTFTYFKHDRKIKDQEKLINDHHLKKIKEEELSFMQADVRATLMKGDKGKRILRIFNKGKAAAYNIRLELEAEAQALFSSNPFPFQKMNEHENVDLKIYLHKGSPNNIGFTILWDDEYGKDNKHKQIVQL